MSEGHEFREARKKAPGEVRTLLNVIVVDVILTILKFMIGSATHSAALVADGFKDLSEAVRTVLKVVLQHVKRDVRQHRERPRIALRTEQILYVIVLLSVAYMGIRSITESYRDVMEDHETNYTPALIIISAVSVALKSFFAYHLRRLGEQLGHDELIDESYDAVMDSAIATAILVGAIIDHTMHIDIDPLMGYAIGGVILIHVVRSLMRRRKARQLLT